MNVDEYEIVIASPIDREYLVAEISKENDFFAEINLEHEYIEIQIYRGKTDIIKLSFEPFYDALNKAKLHLAAGYEKINNMTESTRDCLRYFRISETTDDCCSVQIFYKKELVSIISCVDSHIELYLIYGSKECLSFPFDPFYFTLGKAKELLSKK